jgi:hypothetical protein
MFTSLLLAAALASVEGVSAQGTANTSPPPAASEPRPYHDFHSQISELLKREAQAKEPSARSTAIRQICSLHGEIVRDPRFSTSDKLKEYRARLWSRLKKVQADLKRELARSADKSDKQALEDAQVLESADANSIAAADSLAASLALLDQSQGGPGYLLALGGGAVPGDHGRELVALIERTINPAFWDVVGGPGTIMYYPPLQCLVVRATSEVHGNVGGLLGGLRAAGP